MKTNKKAKRTIFIVAAAILVLLVSVIIVASCAGSDNFDDDPPRKVSSSSNSSNKNELNNKENENIFDDNENNQDNENNEDNEDNEDVSNPKDNIVSLDVFRHIKDYVVFEGVNGHGEVSFDNSKVPSKDELIFQSGNYYVRSDKWRDAKDSIYFYVVYNTELAFDFCCSITSERENLSAGMTVSLKLEIIKDYDITDRWVFAATEYNIIVKESDLGEYLRDYELKFSETIEKVKSFLEAQDNLGFDGKDIVSFDSFYLATINPGIKNEHENKYALVAILYKDNGWWDGYYCYALYDIFYMGDSIFADLDCLVTLEETASDAFAELDDDYTYELIMKLE